MKQLGDLPLTNIQVGLTLTNPLHPKLISFFVALSPWCPHSRASLGVEHSELKSGHVGALAHLSTERINLPCEVPLGQPSNRRVAGHLPDGVCVHRQHERLASHPR